MHGKYTGFNEWYAAAAAAAAAAPVTCHEQQELQQHICVGALPLASILPLAVAR